MVKGGGKHSGVPNRVVKLGGQTEVKKRAIKEGGRKPGGRRPPPPTPPWRRCLPPPPCSFDHPILSPRLSTLSDPPTPLDHPPSAAPAQMHVQRDKNRRTEAHTTHRDRPGRDGPRGHTHSEPPTHTGTPARAGHPPGTPTRGTTAHTGHPQTGTPAHRTPARGTPARDTHTQGHPPARGGA